MNNQHESIDSMLQYIHDVIKRDCERHILINQPNSTPFKITNDMIDDVKHQNTQMILYAIKIIKDYQLDEHSISDIDWVINVYPRLYKIIYGKDLISIWGSILQYFGKNYTDNLKVSKMLYIPRVLGGY